MCSSYSSTTSTANYASKTKEEYSDLNSTSKIVVSVSPSFHNNTHSKCKS